MLESLIPGAVWRAIDLACRRLKLRRSAPGPAWDVQIEIKRAKGRTRETERLWKMTKREVEEMLNQFPPLKRHEDEDENRLAVHIRFKETEKNQDDSSAAPPPP